MAARCKLCQKEPVQNGAGFMCVNCGIVTSSETVWEKLNGGVKKKDVFAAIQRLKGPVSTLQAVCALTTDSGLRALAASSLHSISAMDFSEYMANQEAAKEFNELLRKECPTLFSEK